MIPADGDNDAVDVTFNQYEKVKQLDRMHQSKYATGSDYSNGDKKFYFNMVKPRTGHATKNLDLDTKDLRAITEESTNYMRTFLLQKRINRWMKEHKISQLLNQISEELPIFGVVVLKKVNNPSLVEVVDLRHLINDQTVRKLKDSSYIAELHYMTPSQLRKRADDWNPEAVQKAIDLFKSTNKNNYGRQGEEKHTIPSYIEVWEVYAEVPAATLIDAQMNLGEIESQPIPKEFEDEYVKAKFILAGVDEMETKRGTSHVTESGKEKGVVMFAEEVTDEEFPYKEVSYGKAKGRWLPVGVVEDLIDIQEMRNESINNTMQAMRIATLQLFQTQGEMIEQNLLSDAEPGDVIRAPSGLGRVDTTDVGTGTSSYVDSQVEQLANLLANTPEVVTGESLPSGTPFRLGAQLNVNANKLFEFKRETIGEAIREVLNEWVVPALIEDLKKESILDLADEEDDLSLIYDSVRNHTVLSGYKDFVLSNRRVPNPEELSFISEAITQQLQTTGLPKVTFPEGYFDIKFKLDFMITGEKYDKATVVETLSSIMQIVAGNPTILTNPTTRGLFQKLLEFVGIAPNIIKEPIPQATPQLAEAEAAPGGGGGKPRSVTTEEPPLPSGVTKE